MLLLPPRNILGLRDQLETSSGPSTSQEHMAASSPGLIVNWLLAAVGRRYWLLSQLHLHRQCLLGTTSFIRLPRFVHIRRGRLLTWVGVPTYCATLTVTNPPTTDKPGYQILPNRCFRMPSLQ